MKDFTIGNMIFKNRNPLITRGNIDYNVFLPDGEFLGIVKKGRAVWGDRTKAFAHRETSWQFGNVSTDSPERAVELIIEHYERMASGAYFQMKPEDVTEGKRILAKIKEERE